MLSGQRPTESIGSIQVYPERIQKINCKYSVFKQKVLVKFFEVAFWQLQKEFEFVRVKNKFGEEGLRPELRTNILVNLWVKYLELYIILVVSVCSTL